MSESIAYSLLITGDIFDNHIIRFIGNLKEENPSVTIDVLATKNGNSIPDRIKTIVRNIYWINETYSKNKYSREFNKIFSIRSVLKHIGRNNHYNIVNIHFPIEEYGFAVGLFRNLADTILITPWGSDIYRCGKRGLFLLNRLFYESDYVCGTGNRFNKDVQKLFHLPDSKFVNLDIGSETIDYITEKKSEIDATTARRLLNLDGDYFITCGYNAHKEQHHLAIIDSINSIKKSLPSNTVLIFPLTYPKDEQYINEIKKRLTDCSLHSALFVDYLQLSDLFLMRQATDMFIHVQSTDANAASVQEYILLGKNVVNGSWLRYSELETKGLPYHLTESLDSLPQSILESFEDGPTKVSEDTMNYIASYGWKPWIKKWNTFFISTL